MGILIRFAVTAIAVYVTSMLFPQLLSFGDTTTLIIFAAVLALLNAFVRPVVLMLTCPFQLMTLGLLTFVINALLLLIAASLSGVNVGFVQALLASIVISIVSTIISIVMPR